MHSDENLYPVGLVSRAFFAVLACIVVAAAVLGSLDRDGKVLTEQYKRRHPQHRQALAQIDAMQKGRNHVMPEVGR